MNKYRIGTDIPFQLSVSDGVEYLDLSQVTVRKVVMYNDNLEAFAGPCTFELNSSDNTKLDCVYPGSCQVYLGPLRVVVVMIDANEEEKTYDLEDIFEIVETAEEANATEETVTSATLSAWSLPISTLSTIVEAAINATEAATESTISEISYTASTEDDGVNVLHIEQADGTEHDFNIKNGSRGSQGPQGETGPQGEQGPQGLQGNTGSSVDYPFELVNNVTTDDATKALSAAMGVQLESEITELSQKIATNVSMILASLGDYAFPNGKPTIVWDSSFTVTRTLNNISCSNNADTVDENDPFYAVLSPSSNLYILDDDNIAVTMGGINVTSQVYSNGVIDIPSVTGNIEIIATGLTYPSGLVFNLDGLNKGNDNTRWTDLVANVEFALTDCVFTDDGVQFLQSTSLGQSSNQAFSNFLLSGYTIECCFKLDSAITNAGACFLYHSYNSAIALNWNLQYSCYSIAEMDSNVFHSFNSTPGTSKTSVSFSIGNGMINGEQNSGLRRVYFTPASGSVAYIGNRADLARPINGTLYAIRIYNKALTTDEKTQSYKVDQARFNF